MIRPLNQTTTITVHGRDCGTIHDLVKGRCYEFCGDWADGGLWVRANDHYITPIQCPSDSSNESEKRGCAKILKYDIINGEYPRGQIIRAAMEYKSNLNTEADFLGVLLVRSPSGQVYSGSERERTPAYGQDDFGYNNKGNPIDLRIPDDATLGSYAARLEIRRADTTNYAMQPPGLRTKFRIADTEKSKCIGTISGHVYDAITKKPIKGAGVCDTDDKDVCNGCIVTNRTGAYVMGTVPGEEGECSFCPSTTYRIKVLPCRLLQDRGR